VNCRKFKHKYEYAKVQTRKQKKSKPVFESEDEPYTLTPRHPRSAATAARRAIKEAVDSSPITSISKPRVSKSRPKGN
jgi:hypothetical protein